MRTLIITGGSSGIGQATADLFAAKGYKVFELSRHGENRVGITHIDCDVTSYDDCRNAAAKVAAETGKIDVLISNAGIGISGAVEFTDINEAKRQFDVNFFGAANIAQAVLPYMRNERNGRIIFVSSLAATFPIPYQAFYSASKSAINAMAMAMCNEVREFDIKVCCLLPGDIKTGFTNSRTKSNAGSDVYTRMSKAVKKMEHDEQNGIMPERIARKLLALASQGSPCMFSTVGLRYHLFVLLNKILPATLVNRVIGMMY